MLARLNGAEAMHELSVAQSILEIIHQNVTQDDLNLVRTVSLKVGDQAGIVCDSLEFSFHALIAGTPLAGAALSVERIPYTIHCNNCQKTLESPYGLGICPDCSGTATTVVSGTELQVTTIELDEPSMESS